MKKFIVILLLLVSPVFAQDSNNVKILNKINELRVSKGLNILKYDVSLHKIANRWCKYLIRELNIHLTDSILSKQKHNEMFMHINYERRFKELLKRSDINGVGENLHIIMDREFDEDFVEDSFDSWKKSPHHYELMIEKENTNVAFSYVYEKIKKRLLCILVITENIENKKGG